MNNSTSLEEYIEHWKENFRNHEKNLKERKEILINYAKICAEILKKEFLVKDVYIIGSLARDTIHMNSDIDLVVVGLKDKQYFKALRRIYDKIPKNVKVDLITKETASKSLKSRIKSQGMEI